jgi:hypothetical protein
MPSRRDTIIRAVAALKKIRRVPFALFGASALSVRGVKRETEDVDFLLRSDTKREAVRLLKAAGFKVVEQPDESQVVMRDSNGVETDLLFARGEPYDTIRADAELEADGTPVATAEGLILAYLLSDQPRHKDDGIRLLRRKLVNVRWVQNWLWEEGDRGSLLRLRRWIEAARKPEGGLFGR